MNNAKGIGRIADFIQSYFSAGVGSNDDVIAKIANGPISKLKFYQPQLKSNSNKLCNSTYTLRIVHYQAVMTNASALTSSSEHALIVAQRNICPESFSSLF